MFFWNYDYYLISLWAVFGNKLHFLLTNPTVCFRIRCIIVSNILRYSLVISHVEKHKQDQEKPNSLFDMINEERKRENK